MCTYVCMLLARGWCHLPSLRFWFVWSRNRPALGSPPPSLECCHCRWVTAHPALMWVLRIRLQTLHLGSRRFTLGAVSPDVVLLFKGLDNLQEMKGTLGITARHFFSSFCWQIKSIGNVSEPPKCDYSRITLPKTRLSVCWSLLVCPFPSAYGVEWSVCFNQLRTIVATSPLKKTPLQTQNGVSFTSAGSPSCVYPTACGPFQFLPRLSSGYALILWHSQSRVSWHSRMGAKSPSVSSTVFINDTWF